MTAYPAGGSATLVHEVVRPDGTTVCAPTVNVESSCLLDAAGLHKILVRDGTGTGAGTGTYTVELDFL